uniref:Uncharacterized protein n=1 Tax=Noccaea caerulescens TaxID=107243 RepID=A0A1J3HPK9_NOCCA
MAQALDSYPFPSNLHVDSSVTLKLNETNYLLWKTQFEALLRSQKLLGFVNGQVSSPPATVTTVVNGVAVETPNPAFEAWNCTDQLIKSWIFGTLTEEVLGYVHGLATSQDVWLSLADNFNESYVAREFDLRRRLQLLSTKGKDFLTYCREFRTICDQLSAIGKPVEESMKIFTFLNGLSREFDPISTVIQSSLSRFPPPTFNDVVSEISGFHTQLQSYETPEEVTPFTAFQVQKSNYSHPGQRGRGHSSSRFGSRGRGGFSTRGRGFSQQVNPAGWNQSLSSDGNQNNRPMCQICGRMGHTALKCWNMFDHAYQSDDVPKALAALHISDDSGMEWYPDSGATAHITASASSLQNPTPYHGSDMVLVGNGNQLPITHVGSTAITTPQESGDQRTSQ